LFNLGFSIGQPDPNNRNRNWGYGLHEVQLIQIIEGLGLHKTEKMSHTQRIEVFAYHLKNFETLGLKFPEQFFREDVADDFYNNNLILLNGQIVPIDSKQTVDFVNEDDST
jgi:hypothetical protein